MLVYQGENGLTPLDFDDYYIQEEWNGWEDSIRLSLPVDHPQRLDLVERLRLTDRESGQIYAITVIDEGTRTTDITAVLDLAELEADMLLGYTNGSDTALSTIEGVLPHGWTVDDHTGGLTIRRTVTLEGGGTPLDVIVQCVDKFSGLAIRFDNAARMVHLWYPSNLTVSGAYYTDELNLTERPQFRGRASDFYTRLYPVGKDGLTIADVNNGVPYVECHDWSDEIISRYWQDERYTDAQTLLEDAQTTVNNAGIPERSYVCAIADLAKVDPDKYGHLTASMYQIVTLIDRSRKSRVRHHVAQYRRYPYHPEQNTITLSTVPGKLSGKLGSVYAAVTDTAGKTDFAQRQAARISKLNDALSNASGLYPTEETQPDGSVIYYLHDRPTLAASQTVIKVTAEAIGISTDGGQTYNVGIAVDGDTIVRILTAVGVDASWINAGRILVKDADGNTVFLADAESGELVGTKGTIGGLTMSAKSLTATYRHDYPAFTQADYDKAGQYIVGNTTLTDEELEKYDVNMDGAVTSVDRLGMQKMMNGTAPSYSIYQLTIDATDPRACVKVEITDGYHAGWKTQIGIGALTTRDLVATDSVRARNILEVKGSQVTDFVVGQGTDGIWTWRKWSSGRAECWGTVTLNPTADGTTSAGTSYSTINYVDLPFSMNNMVITGTAQNLCTISNPNSSGSQAAFRLMRPGTMSTEVAVKLYVCGDLA